MSRTVFLLLLALALAGASGLVLRRGAGNEDTMPFTPPNTPPARAAALRELPSGQDREWAGILLARPLFTPGRRPASAPVTATPAAAAIPRVTGIIVEGGQRSVIFAASGEKTRPLVLKEGAEVNGFTIVSIEDSQVTVMGPAGRRVLRPSFDPNLAAPGSAPGSSSSAPGLPGLPSLSGLSGIPGLTPPGGGTR